MSWASLGAFTVAMTALCVVPGPAVLLVVSQALSHGSAKATWSILGITAAGTAWFVLSATGIGAALTASTELFFAIKWVGVVYLLWLGASAFWRTSMLAAVRPDAGSGQPARLFWGGFVLQMANPNVLLFFTAFLPQFIAPKAPLVPQLAVLAVVTAVIELFVQLGYAFLAGRFRLVLAAPRFAQWTERVAGGIMIAAGLAMASSVAHADPAASDAYRAKDCGTAMEKSTAALQTAHVDFAMHVIRNECLADMADKAAEIGQTKRSMVMVGGHGFDADDATDKNGKTRTVYFNIDAFVWGLGKASDSGSQP